MILRLSRLLGGESCNPAPKVTYRTRQSQAWSVAVQSGSCQRVS